MSDIIDFDEARKNLGGPSSLDYEYSRGPICMHRRVVVVIRDRLVECKHCQVQLDAFNVLTDYAMKERTFQFHRAEEKEIRERIEKLKREEKNLKARIRRARLKAQKVLPTAEVVEP